MNQKKVKQIRREQLIPVGYKRKYYLDKNGTIHADPTRKEYQKLKRQAEKNKRKGL